MKKLDAPSSLIRPERGEANYLLLLLSSFKALDISPLDMLRYARPQVTMAAWERVCRCFFDEFNYGRAALVIN
jgi:hypothetical protein